MKGKPAPEENDQIVAKTGNRFSTLTCGISVDLPETEGIIISQAIHTETDATDVGNEDDIEKDIDLAGTVSSNPNSAKCKDHPIATNGTYRLRERRSSSGAFRGNHPLYVSLDSFCLFSLFISLLMPVAWDKPSNHMFMLNRWGMSPG